MWIVPVDCNEYNKIPWPLYALEGWMMIMDYYNIPLALNVHTNIIILIIIPILLELNISI